VSARQPSTPPDIPGLRYLDLIGMGGFADVFQYEQLGLNRNVAVKVLLRDLSDSVQRSFEAEANLMARLSNHPSIVSVFSSGQASDGRPYLVMEYCPPPTLAVRIRKSPLSVMKTLEMGIQIAAAIEMAHRLGILHRDIKPANILFTEYGRPALTDFGISVTTESARQGQGVGLSVPWAPPEQLTSGQEMGPASDVYSLAATLWTALAGRTPFELADGPNDAFAMSKRIRNDPLPPLNRQGAPSSLSLILRTALSKDPSLRYSSALEFARALQNVQTELHLSVTPIDILEASTDGDETDQPPDTGTELVNPISISADQFTNQDPRWASSSHSQPRAGFISHGRGSSGAEPVRQFTALPVPQLATVDVPVTQAAPGTIAGTSVVAQSTPSRGRGVLIGILAGSVLVGGGGYLGLRVLNQGAAATQDTSASASASVQPKDPIGPRAPAPIHLTLELSGEQVQVSWENPEPENGDTYLWAVIDPTQQQPTTPTTETRIVVAAQPGRTCVQVQLVRANGRYSDPAKGCTT